MNESTCLLHNQKVGASDKACPAHTTVPLDDPEVDMRVRIVCLNKIECGTCVHYEAMRKSVREDAEKGVKWAIKLLKELEGPG